MTTPAKLELGNLTVVVTPTLTKPAQAQKDDDKRGDRK